MPRVSPPSGWDWDLLAIAPTATATYSHRTIQHPYPSPPCKRNSLESEARQLSPPRSYSAGFTPRRLPAVAQSGGAGSARWIFERGDRRCFNSRCDVPQQASHDLATPSLGRASVKWYRSGRQCSGRPALLLLLIAFIASTERRPLHPDLLAFPRRLENRARPHLDRAPTQAQVGLTRRKSGSIVGEDLSSPHIAPVHSPHIAPVQWSFPACRAIVLANA